MSKRDYIVLCEERCCECKGAGELADKTPCKACDERGFNKYPVNLKKALVDLVFNSMLTGDADE